MKTMHGAACLACSNRSRTRLAPTPTNISTKSEPEIEKNGTPASPATSLKPILGESGAMRLARLLPKLITFEPPPCTWFIRKIQKPNRSTNGSNDVRIDHHGLEPTPFESKVTPFFWSSVWKAICDW